MGYRNYSTANGHIVSKTGNGDFATIGAALTAATSGQTIFIRPGTYTEDVTLVAGVNLTAFGSDSSLNQTGAVIINGNCTMSTAGTVTISGIQLQTNSEAFLTVSGSVASVVNLNNCNLNCSNNTGIIYSSSSGSSAVNLNNCTGDIGTTGIGLFTITASGILTVNYCNITNSGLTTTASTVGHLVTIYYSLLYFPISSTVGGNIFYSSVNCQAINTTALTTATTGTWTANDSIFSSGTASCISVGSSTVVSANRCHFISSNADAVTGSGNFNYQGLTFSSVTSAINVTTQTSAGTLLGGVNQAPTAGFLGEQITASASAVATTSTSPTEITTVSLTAGIWDISSICTAVPTGGAGVMSVMQAGISTSSSSQSGTLGQQYGQLNVTGAGNLTISVPVVRATLTSTTPYYLVCTNTYTSTTCPTNGRLTATRVG